MEASLSLMMPMENELRLFSEWHHSQEWSQKWQLASARLQRHRIGRTFEHIYSWLSAGREFLDGVKLLFGL